MEQLNLTDYDSIVILAPHPDDELLGCYSLFKEEYRDKVSVIYLTDGCFYDYPRIRSKEAATIRKKEFEKLCEKFNFSYYCMDIKDSHLRDNMNTFLAKMNTASKILGFRDKKTAFFVPHQQERHEDHKCVRQMLCHWFFFHCTTNQRLNFKIHHYEVWTPMIEPKYYIEIDSTKADCMKYFYPSQVKVLPSYCQGILGLNRYRGLQLLKDGYYEVFS